MVLGALRLKHHCPSRAWRLDIWSPSLLRRVRRPDLPHPTAQICLSIQNSRRSAQELDVSTRSDLYRRSSFAQKYSCMDFKIVGTQVEWLTVYSLPSIFCQSTHLLSYFLSNWLHSGMRWPNLVSAPLFYCPYFAWYHRHKDYCY